MKSQANQSPQTYNCSICKQSSNHIVQLTCNHTLCLKCLTFSYHKFSSAMPRTNFTKCMLCQRSYELTQEDLQGINEFTDKVLMPLVKEENEKESGKSKTENNQYQLSNNSMNSANKLFKSHDLSSQKVTPGKGFYSRCQSPKSGFNQILCQVHPEQQLSIICFTCSNSLLCISCIANKKHNSHNIKTISKGLQIIYQQIALSNLKGKEYLDRLQISKRRLEDKRSIIQQKWDKTINSLRVNFNHLQDLVNRKYEEVLQGYSSFFQRAMEDAVRDGVKVDQAFRHVKRQLQKLVDVSKIQINPIQIIKKSTQLMQQIKQLRQPQTSGGQTNHCDSDRVIRQIVHLCEKIQKIEPLRWKESLKTYGVDNCKSQEKLLKDNYFKRVKTNIMSLNSSRDRKEKKCTKTQQDEKRNKSKANYKTQSSSKLLKVNKALPSYLLQHLDKQTKDSPLPQCLMDLNPLQNSFKSTSKILSKTHIPSANEQHRRKKEHVAYIKECLQRKQRKTFNGTSKQARGTAQGMRKKKIPF